MKRVVGGREDGERAGAFERVDQAGGFHRGDQRGVVGGVDGVVDDVLGGNISLPPTMGFFAANAMAAAVRAMAMRDFFTGFSFRELDASLGITSLKGNWI